MLALSSHTSEILAPDSRAALACGFASQGRQCKAEGVSPRDLGDDRSRCLCRALHKQRYAQRSIVCRQGALYGWDPHARWLSLAYNLSMEPTRSTRQRRVNLAQIRYLPGGGRPCSVLQQRKGFLVIGATEDVKIMDRF